MKYVAQIVFFLGLLAVKLGVYRDYGISIDEPMSRQNGAVTLKYVAERFAPSLTARAEFDQFMTERRNRPRGDALLTRGKPLGAPERVCRSNLWRRLRSAGCRSRDNAGHG